MNISAPLYRRTKVALLKSEANLLIYSAPLEVVLWSVVNGGREMHAVSKTSPHSPLQQLHIIFGYLETKITHSTK